MGDLRTRPQDRVVLRAGAAEPEQRVINPRSVVLWTALSLPLVGYFVWYLRAQRDCSALLDDDSDPWFWLAMVFPGMFLVLPYAIAQARLVARVEVATRKPLGTVGFVSLCAGGFFIPALMPLFVQGRLNQAARTNPTELRRLRLA